MTPATLDWRTFENLCVERGKLEHGLGNGIWRRNENKAAYTKDGLISKPSWVDFSGTVLMPGIWPTDDPDVFREGMVPWPIHFDCKRTEQASLSLQPDHFSRKQKRQLMEHARYGATCFLLVHYCERELKTKTDKAETIAIPVHPEHKLWVMVERQLLATISRETAKEYGVRVAWTKPGKTRKYRPDILAAVHDLMLLDVPKYEEPPAPF